jgi:hypothetical protein
MLGFNREIHELEQGKTCKYPRTEKSESIQQQQMKARLQKEYTSISRMLMKSELHDKIKITVTGALVVQY